MRIWFRRIVAVALLVIGLARGFAGVYLAATGHTAIPGAAATDEALRMTGVMLALVCLLGVAAAIALIRRRPAAVLLAGCFLVAFPIDAAFNFYALTGHFGGPDVASEAVISLVLGTLLWAAVRSGPAA